MKLLPIALVLLLGACGSESADEDTSSLTEPGTPLAVGVGESFTIRLASNATTGFTWTTEVEPPADVLVQTGDVYLAPDTELVGAGGVQELTFEGTGPGSVTLQLWYIRPFEDPPRPAEGMTFPVTVTG